MVLCLESFNLGKGTYASRVSESLPRTQDRDRAVLK